MNEGIMFVIGCGALIGGIDRILGNRLGLGQKFEEGFQLMGATALSMAGIICLAPVLAGLLSYLITPVFSLAGIDPAMSGCILAIDMGGYQLSMGLAHEMSIGAFSGIIASSMAGCTLVFTIPVGMKVIAEHDRSDFLKGISAGLIGMPVGLLIGGLVQGLSFLTVLHQSLPVIVLSIILLYGLLRHTEKNRLRILSFRLFRTGCRNCRSYHRSISVHYRNHSFPLDRTIDTGNGNRCFHRDCHAWIVTSSRAISTCPASPSYLAWKTYRYE